MSKFYLHFAMLNVYIGKLFYWISRGSIAIGNYFMKTGQKAMDDFDKAEEKDYSREGRCPACGEYVEDIRKCCSEEDN